MLDSLLTRVDHALDVARTILDRYDGEHIAELKKDGGDPVTEVDLELDGALRSVLQRAGEGWLSEETADDQSRLRADLVWVVDPLDGTREFIDGLPEFCTSIAAVMGGRAVMGGIVNPAADVKILGGPGVGIREETKEPRSVPSPGVVLASRSEVLRGQWEVVEEAGYSVTPMGSVAYKLARVAAGLDWATWTPVSKNEWDVAAGAALLEAGGGYLASTDDWKRVIFNRPDPLLPGVIALNEALDQNREIVAGLIELQAQN